jgi:cytochrome c biogenesis protein CcmG/thiol:disulfide interchange protein DsbE
MRPVLYALAGLALVAVVVVGLLQAGGSDEAATTGPPEPLARAEVLEALRGAPPQLAALHAQGSELLDGGAEAFDARLRELRGRPVVVNMWASWCGPCRFELPFFQAQAARRGDEVAFLGLNVGDNAGDAADFAAEYFMPYPSFQDPQRRILGRFGAAGLPATAYYDADGELSFLHQGLYASEAKLSEAIERYALNPSA